MDYSNSCSAFPDSAKVAFLVLIGLPGSGKTTLTQSLPYILGNKHHIIHICYDEVIPFKEVVGLDEKRGSWKSERAKVLQATESLLNNLLSSYNLKKECSCDLVSLPKKHMCLEDTDLESGKKYVMPDNECDILCVRGNSEIFLERMGTDIDPSNQEMKLSFTGKKIEIDYKGHYTMLDSFQSPSSIRDKISDCDFQSEIFLVVIDDNCYYRSMRKEWWNLAAKYQLPFCIITLKCDLEVCIKRVRERFNSCPVNSPNIPATVIRKMDSCLEFPNGELYHWEKHSIIINTGSFNNHVPNSPLLIDRDLKLNIHSMQSLSDIRNLISSAIREPAKYLYNERHSSDAAVTKSVIHAADLALRKIVSESDPKIRLQINIKRKKVLEDLKSRKVIIPSDVLEEKVEGFGLKFDEYLASLLDLHIFIFHTNNNKGEK